MQTILTLITNMFHSTTAGFIGVAGIFLFMALMIGSGIYRAAQALKEEEHH